MKKLLIGFVLFLLAASVLAIKVKIRYEQPLALDSLRIIFMESPFESTDTLKDTTTGSVYWFDTAWTVTAGIDHWWCYTPFFTGNDSGGPSTNFSYNGAAGGASIDVIMDSASANPQIFYGSTNTGTGSYVVGFYTVDTTVAGVYDTTSFVTVNIYDMTYSLLLSKATSSTGYTYFNMNADTFIVTGNSLGMHDWRVDTFVVTAAATRLLKGFELWQEPVSSTAKTASVVVTVIDNQGQPAENVYVYAELVNDEVVDSAGHLIRNTPQEKKTNALGKATFQCIWSSYLIPATKWRFYTKVSDAQIKQDKTVPRQTSYNVNLSE